jgi:hypothetical protein
MYRLGNFWAGVPDRRPAEHDVPVGEVLAS